MVLVINFVALKMSLNLKKKIFIFSFLFLLFSLASLFYMRHLLISDFNDFLEGEVEDRVYWLTNYLEQRYEKEGELSEKIAEDVIRLALMMGFEIKIFDDSDKLISDTHKTYNKSDEYIKRRLSSYYRRILNKQGGEFKSYPLFSKGEEIGNIEIKFVESNRKGLFLKRSGIFLLLAGFITLLGTFLFSFLLSRNMLVPVEILYKATKKVISGEKNIRLKKLSNDELGELIDAFNDMWKTLKQVEEARKISVAKFAHELRTPITIIQGELEGMLDGVMEIDKQRIYSIYEELERLKKMVYELESLYRLEKKTKMRNREKINLTLFFNAVKDIFKNEISKKDGLNLIIDCPDEIYFLTDQDMLRQLICNLISNAINSTDKGYIKVTAKKESNILQIVVEDTGKGIERNDIPFIFDPFYGKGKGLGIGLAIVREIVDIFEGKIEVESEKGKGTRFIITLPEK